MELKETKTYANLLAAFAGESQAKTKYEIFAQKARTEGYEQIGQIFDETSDNEKAHARVWLEYIMGNSIPSTLENLKDAAAGEHYEWTQMYQEFAEQARKDGFKDIAAKMELIAKVERDHDNRYTQLVQNLETGEVFKRVGPQKWICLNCGFVYEGPTAPEKCPICAYPQSFFQIKAENY